jgi:fibronectin type 3 domain-containing protein
MRAQSADRHSAAMTETNHIPLRSKIASYVLLALLGVATLSAAAQSKGRVVSETVVTIPNTQKPHSVALSWQESTPDVTFTVYRGVASGQEERYQAGITSNNYTDTGVSAGVTYYYEVTAVDSTNQESGYSNEAKAAIPPASVASSPLTH